MTPNGTVVSPASPSARNAGPATARRISEVLPIPASPSMTTNAGRLWAA